MSKQIKVLPDSPLKSFNINDYVYVRLNDTGRKIYGDYWAKYSCEPIPLIEEDNGYSKWQLWDLMNVFGEHIFNGCRMPFDCNILIQEKDLGEFHGKISKS
jgi:hypothetical protein